MTMAYDKQGQMAGQTDFDGKSTTYYFDFQSRMTKQSDAVGDYVQYVYDSWGQVSLMMQTARGTPPDMGSRP